MVDAILRRASLGRSQWILSLLRHRSVFAIALLAVVTATIAWISSRSLHHRLTGSRTGSLRVEYPLELVSRQAHILMSFDDADAPGFAVAARSILQSTADPSLVHFHLVVSPGARKIVHKACKQCLQGLQGDGLPVGAAAPCDTPGAGAFCCDDQVHILEGIDTETETVVGWAAERIKSPFNAARFSAIDAMADVAPRIAFLDPDIAVVGDVQELVWMNLEGNPAAMCPRPDVRGNKWPTMCFPLAALDCDNGRVRKSLEKWGESRSRLKREWLGNGGILVIDTQEWVRQEIGESARTWMERNGGGRMWTLGTQPPTNMALLGRRARIPQTWNTGWDMVGRVHGGDQAPKLMHFKGPSHKAWRASTANMATVKKGRFSAQRYYDLSVLYHETCFVGGGSKPAARVRGISEWSWESNTGTRVPASSAGVVSRYAAPYRFRMQPVVLLVVLLDGDEEEFVVGLRSAEGRLEAPWPWSALQVLVVAEDDDVFGRAVDRCFGSSGGPSDETCRSIERVGVGLSAQAEGGVGGGEGGEAGLKGKGADGSRPFLACRRLGGRGLVELLPHRSIGTHEVQVAVGQEQGGAGDEGVRETMAREGLREAWDYVHAAVVLPNPAVEFAADPAGIAECRPAAPTIPV